MDGRNVSLSLAIESTKQTQCVKERDTEKDKRKTEGQEEKRTHTQTDQDNKEGNKQRKENKHTKVKWDGMKKRKDE